MDEYIEREETCKKCVRYGMGETLCTDCVVKAAPAADVSPVKHGRWDKNHPEDNIVYCDQCYIPQDMPTPFCHNCGAKMDGGDAGCP